MDSSLYKISASLLLALLLSSCVSWGKARSGSAAKGACWNDINFKKTERLLKTSPIKEKIPIYKYPGLPEEERERLFKKYTTHRKHRLYPLILVFDGGTKAIFKRFSKQKMRSGAEKIWNAVSAYELAQFLDLKLVPPTVVRYVDGEAGIAQLFIDHSAHDDKAALLQNLSPGAKGNIYIFNFISGDCDFNYSNLLFGRNCEKPALIDNDKKRCFFQQYGDYPFQPHKILGLKIQDYIEDYRQFPFDKAQSIPMRSSAQMKAFLISNNIGQHHSFLIKDAHEYVDNTLYFVRWKNAFWIKRSHHWMINVVKNYSPIDFPQKTIQRLKALSRRQIHLLIVSLKWPGSLKKHITNSNSSIWHNRNIILEEILKIKKNQENKNPDSSD